MTVQSRQDLRGLKRIGQIVAFTRKTMLNNLQPGITTAELDEIAGKVFAYYGARSAPRLTYKFPGFTCISVNNEVAHGIPGPKMIHGGDLVNIDVSAELDGYYADTGATVVVEPAPLIIEPSIFLKQNLCRCSRFILHQSISAMRPGIKLNAIGNLIYRQAKTSGFTVIKNLSGHGIGRKLHEGNYELLNYYNPSNKKRIHAGLVLAVETFVAEKEKYVCRSKDGWTLKTPHGTLAAQFEHTIIVTDSVPIVITV
ncbi:peptidase m24 methionine aminopeptidase [Lucifera butyrica]|uniref:Methionine aminopeptidase n=2 Tax=Lucifera butyrica TaxID=1351585 RepID=A0A498RFX6_9FIRM|nr:peptidase m24 methionine aminopeptidase [Lucifera butyrica]